MDSVKIQVNFSITDPETGSVYSDALYFTPEEYAKLKPADIDKMKQDRFTNWLKAISTPPPPVPDTTSDDINSHLDDIKAQIDILKQKVENLPTPPDQEVVN